jgi:hypothetical protein
LPQNKAVSIDLSLISGNKKNVWWFDPKTGASKQGRAVNGKSARTFTPPTEGKDWVLVIDDSSKGFSAPGIVK